MADAAAYDAATVRSLLLASIRRKTPVFGYSPALVRAGALLGVLGALLRRGKLAVLLPLALAGLCAISEYVVTPAIADVKPRSFGAAQEEGPARRFSDLHQTSRYLFGTTVITIIGVAHCQL